MSFRPATLVLLATLGSISINALAQAPAPAPRTRAETEEAQPTRPAERAPDQPPPPPPDRIPAPPPTRPQAAPDQQLPSGQWVYTEQYGWVWMPKDDKFTHVPDGGGTPSMYVYYPDAGWCWVVAPWIWGWGPRPYFGLLGPVGFGWWGVGFGHWYGFEGRWGRWGHGGWGVYHGGTWHHEAFRGSRGLIAPWRGAARGGGRGVRIR